MRTHVYGGYAPCGSASVITLLQKYRFPLSPSNTTPILTHSLHTPTNNKLAVRENSSLFTLSVSDHPIIHKHTLSSFSFTFIRSLPPVCSLPPRCSLFAFHWLKRSSRCRTTKFTSSIKHEISSSSPCLCQSPWERPWVGVSASWLSLIQDREGRLICIADSCATIGYILPHPEPTNKQTNKQENNNKIGT